MLDFAATVAITAVMVVVVNAVIGALQITRTQRIALAIIVGLWIGLVAATTGIGWIGLDRPFPVIGLFFAAPLVATGLVAAFSPAARAALLALPTPLLVGLNLARPIGGVFLLLAAQGRLGGPFPVSAGWGDIITGIVAIPVLIMVARGAAQSSSLPGWWNAFGALDLVAAVALGMTSADGSPLQVFASVAGPSPLTALPYVFIPTVLVPVWLVLHAVMFVQFRRGAKRNERLVALQGIA